MGSERVRSMMPALTFGTAKSKVELKVARRGKVSLRGNGVFTADELAQVVEQVRTWVQQLKQSEAEHLIESSPMYPPLPQGNLTEPSGLSVFRDEPFVRGAVAPAAQDSWSGNRSSGSTNSSGIGV